MRNNDFRDVVFNRHSVKKFDKNVKISREEMLEMLEETTKAPSSINMQPWRFVVVESEEAKQKLLPLVKFNVTQNETSAAMVLIFGDMKCYEKADEIYGMGVKKGFITEEKKKELMETFVGFYKSVPREKMNDIVKIDSSLAAMQFMLVARSHGYDTNPIGGFEADRLAQEFGLDPERYVPVIIIAVGKADYETHEAIRLDVKEVVQFK